MKLKTLLSTLLTTTLLAATVATGFGQPLLEENFDYTVGTSLIDNGWIIQGTSTTNVVSVVSGNLSYTDYASSNIGNMVALTNNGQDVYQNYTSQTSGTVYAAILVNISAANTAGDYIMSFEPAAASTSYFSRVFVKGDGSGNVAFGISKASTSTVNYTGFTYALNTTYLLVVKYTFNTGTTTDDGVDMFIDPVVGSPEPSPTISFTDVTSNDAVAAAAVLIRQGTAANAPTLNVDGLRVATTWDEAVKVAAADLTPPAAIFDPANTATDVSSAVMPTITFDEAIFAIGGAAITDPTSLITFTETDAAGTAVPFTAAIDGASKVITITPTSSLTPGQLYYLAIAPVQDAAGNATVDQSIITFTTAATLSTATEITGFTLASVDGTIDAPNHTVSVVLPYGTDVTALAPTIALSQGATVSPLSGVAQDFTNPVTYTVTAEDGVTTMPWMVTVTFTAPEFTATYPKSANVGKNQFDVVVNLKSAAKVYFLEQISGTAAPVSADIKANGTMIDVTTAATDFSSTITGLDASTAYDVYFVTEDNGGTILMATPVKLTVTTSAGTLTIHDVQFTTDPSGDSPKNGQIVTLNGTVTSLKYSAAGAYSGFYIQDAAGAWNGIYVYTSSLTVAQGDNVSVTGTVVEYKGTGTNLSGLTEISPATDVTVISSGNALPEATVVSTLDANSEEYESVLIKVAHATCTGSPSAGTFTVDDGTGVLNLYKSLFPTLALTTGNIYNVTGILTDYSNATSQMYELYPRNADDVVDVTTGISNNSTVATKVFPNPFTSSFTVNSGKVVSTISIYNLLGQKLVEHNYSAAEVTVPAANLTNGIYIVNVRFQDGTATNLRMVKK